MVLDAGGEGRLRVVSHGWAKGTRDRVAAGRWSGIVHEERAPQDPWVQPVLLRGSTRALVGTFLLCNGLELRKVQHDDAALGHADDAIALHHLEFDVDALA